ncbi:MAG: hypothetical protein IKA96_08360 [Alistipes sp.]|nr:hypothetical protein [Alistipes sp.]
MTNQEKQQIKEYFQIQPILDELGLKKEDIISQDKPDILIPNLNGLCIGIEVTTCVPSKIISSNRDRMRSENMIWKACQYYKKRREQKQSGYLMVNFTDKAYDSYFKQNDFNRLIAEEIDKHLRNDKYENYIDHDSDEDIKTYLAMAENGEFSYDYVDSVTIIENPSSLEVGCGYAYCASPIPIGAIEYSVKDKETKLVDYKQDDRNKSINEYWLVVNVPVNEPFHFSNVESSLFTNSTYDRIYMTQMGSLKRLK